MANTGPDPGYLLVTLTVGETTYRVSTEIITLTHLWDAEIISFDAPQYALDTQHGGYCRLGLGTVVFFPTIFKTSWPPPVELSIKCEYTDSTEGVAETFFDGTAYLTGFNRESVTYSLYCENEDSDLLEEGVAYHEDSIFICDGQEGSPLYKWLAYGDEYYLQAYGGGSPGIVEPNRIDENGTLMTEGTRGSLAPGEWAWYDSTVYVRLTDDADPDSKANGYLRADYTDDLYPYPRGFGPVLHGAALRLPNAYSGNYRYCMGSIQGTASNCGTGGGDVWCVYDDGIAIDTNITNVAGNVFEVTTAAPVGEVTICGTGENSTLTDVMSWACESDRLNLTYDATGARGTSPSIVHYATSQQLMVDFLSDLCAFYVHLFYKDTTTLYLVDMLLDNGSRTTDEFEFFPLEYRYNPPIKSISAEWTIRRATDGRTSDGTVEAKYVKSSPMETKVETDYAYGQEMSFTPYHEAKTSVDAALADILTIMQRPYVNWRIPIQGSLPVPGEKISWTDDSLVAGTSTWIRARSIKYDIDSWEVLVEGEGVVSAT